MRCLVGELPNQRLKLSGRGGRLKGKGLVLIAAAAPRSLSAIRYTAAATMTKTLWFAGARATTTKHDGRAPHRGAPSSSNWFPEEQGSWPSAARRPRPPLSNTRLKLAACGRRLRRNAQWKPFALIAAPAGRSLSAIR